MFKNVYKQHTRYKSINNKFDNWSNLSTTQRLDSPHWRSLVLLLNLAVIKYASITIITHLFLRKQPQETLVWGFRPRCISKATFSRITVLSREVVRSQSGTYSRLHFMWVYIHVYSYVINLSHIFRGCFSFARPCKGFWNCILPLNIWDLPLSE